jgi:hypothetical protein
VNHTKVWECRVHNHRNDTLDGCLNTQHGVFVWKVGRNVSLLCGCPEGKE